MRGVLNPRLESKASEEEGDSASEDEGDDGSALESLASHETASVVSLLHIHKNAH